MRYRGLLYLRHIGGSLKMNYAMVSSRFSVWHQCNEWILNPGGAVLIMWQRVLAQEEHNKLEELLLDATLNLGNQKQQDLQQQDQQQQDLQQQDLQQQDQQQQDQQQQDLQQLLTCITYETRNQTTETTVVVATTLTPTTSRCHHHRGHCLPCQLSPTMTRWQEPR